MKLNKLRRPGDTSGNVNVCCGMHPSGRRAEYIECLQNGAHTQPGTHSPDAQTMTYPNIRYALERITWASTAVQVRWNIQPFAHIYFSLLNYTTSMAVFRIIFFFFSSLHSVYFLGEKPTFFTNCARNFSIAEVIKINNNMALCASHCCVRSHSESDINGHHKLSNGYKCYAVTRTCVGRSFVHKLCVCCGWIEVWGGIDGF